jgi:hypothetical protein
MPTSGSFATTMRRLRNYLKSRLPRAESMSPSIPQQGAGELNESEMIEPILVVADEEGAALWQPSQRAFDHPAARFRFLVLAGLGLLTDAADVRHVPVLLDSGFAGGMS